jgi:lactate dehydrogenase-like 2-hydroxyacid dehydrogenase
VLAETTADLAFALILMARRRLIAASDSLRAVDWQLFRMNDYVGLDVHPATLGLVGYGQIGRAVARRPSGSLCALFTTTNTPPRGTKVCVLRPPSESAGPLLGTSGSETGFAVSKRLARSFSPS